MARVERSVEWWDDILEHVDHAPKPDPAEPEAGQRDDPVYARSLARAYLAELRGAANES